MSRRAESRDLQHKVIGILGGMGPFATLEMFREVLSCTKAEKDWEHPRIIIDCNPQIPSRTRAFLYGEESPLAGMVETARILETAGADVLIVPCNSAHYWMSELRSRVDSPILSIVEETARFIGTQGKCNTVGILGAEVVVAGNLYQSALAEYDVRAISDAELQPTTREIIEDVKRNRISDTTTKKCADLIDRLITKGADGVVLACTELPVVANELTIERPLFNPNRVLAEAVLQFVAKDEGR